MSVAPVAEINAAAFINDTDKHLGAHLAGANGAPIESGAIRTDVPFDETNGTYADLDILFKKTGGFGVYQFLLVIYSQWMAILFCSFSTVLYSLGGIPAKYVCLDNECLGVNRTEQDYDACLVRANCTNYTTESSFEFYSYAEEFDLVCENEKWKQFIPSLVSGLGIAYVFILGHVTDHLGRKWTLIACNSLSLTALLLASFSNGWPMLAACMALTLVLEGLSYKYFAEMVTKNYRIVIIVSTQWCLAYPFVSLIAYLTGDWRVFLRVIFAICSPFILAHLLTLVESPRFLLQKEKFSSACKGLEKIATINRVKPFPEEIDPAYLKSLGYQKLERTIPYNVVDLFTGKAIALRTILQSLNRFTYRIAIIVIVLNIQKLSGSPFLNVALLGILKLWVPFFVVFLDWKAPRLKRRWILMLSLGLVTICYVINTSIYYADKRASLKIYLTVASQIAILTLTSIYSLMMQSYNMELFPTTLRNVANGFTSAVYGISGVIGPQILLADQITTWLPSFIVLLLLMFTLLFNYAFLPETRDKPLIESNAQMNDIVKLQQFKFNCTKMLKTINLTDTSSKIDQERVPKAATSNGKNK